MWWMRQDGRAQATEPGAIIDRRETPAGVVPRHLQQWVLVGIAAVMVAIMALSGLTTPHGTRPASAPGTPAIDPSQQRIEEYQRRIQEQAQRLAAEQAELTLAKQAASIASTTPTSGSVASGPTSSGTTPGGAVKTTEGARPLTTREERSLFADNVAFTGAAPPSGTGVPQGRDGLLAPERTAEPGPSAPARPTYRLVEGTVIETVLTNRIDGTFEGPVNCLVTTPLYASDRRHLLIPEGARVLGDSRPVNAFGQTRLAVAFHRLILPDGSRFDLHRVHGLNQAGAAGVSDQVDRHFAQIFGASVAVGAIAGLAQARTSIGSDATPLDAYRQGVAGNVSQSSTRILDRFLNILPTVTIREGHRIKVYLADDLELPAYREGPPEGGAR
jgi:type IV secretion system protein VirB10